MLRDTCTLAIYQYKLSLFKHVGEGDTLMTIQPVAAFTCFIATGSYASDCKSASLHYIIKVAIAERRTLATLLIYIAVLVEQVVHTVGNKAKSPTWWVPFLIGWLRRSSLLVLYYLPQLATLK